MFLFPRSFYEHKIGRSLYSNIKPIIDDMDQSSTIELCYFLRYAVNANPFTFDYDANGRNEIRSRRVCSFSAFNRFDPVISSVYYYFLIEYVSPFKRRLRIYKVYDGELYAKSKELYPIRPRKNYRKGMFGMPMISTIDRFEHVLIRMKPIKVITYNIY